MLIKVGIIGCGGIARRHVTGYTDSGVEITAVTDYSSEAAAGLSKEIGGAKVYGDYRQLIDDAGVQAVSICTPPAAHEEAAIYALEHGVHVLCENEPILITIKKDLYSLKLMVLQNQPLKKP